MKKSASQEKKVAQNVKASKAADRKKAKHSVDKAAKKLADKAVLDIASGLSGGQGNAFLQDHAEHRKAEEAIAAAGKWKRTVRSRMKANKVDMACYDRVNKLAKMDPADAMARKVTEALYEKQLSLGLTAEQKVLVDDVLVKRENARAAMSDLNGGEAGKEIGSHANVPEPTPMIPQRNDSLETFQTAPGPTILSATAGVH